MMNEYCINGLTIKENLLRLAGEGNKKFTESLHPGIENVCPCPGPSAIGGSNSQG